MTGSDIVRRALAELGTPFRLHGRCSGEGLDCVGLVAVAIDARDQPPFNYSLRGDFANQVHAYFKSAGFRKCRSVILDGDIILVRAAPRQMHLLIVAPGGFVHAHAGLRKTVFMPGPLEWPMIGHWRVKGK